ncbi:MAG TPA: 30S ribosomal protein S16 [Planctomycetota bacterium]
MAVVLRMKRTGRKNRPSYRISATNSRNARDGRTLETLGHYDPASPVEALRLKLDPERVKYWLALGAKPSDTVASILRQQGIPLRDKPRVMRERPGRKKPTQAKKHRAERKQRLGAAKVERRKARLAARRAAAKAAPAEGAQA